MSNSQREADHLVSGYGLTQILWLAETLPAERGDYMTHRCGCWKTSVGRARLSAQNRGH